MSFPTPVSEKQNSTLEHQGSEDKFLRAFQNFCTDYRHESDSHQSLEPNDRSCIPVMPKRFGLVSLLPSRLAPVERGIPEDNLRGRPTECTPSPVLPSLLAVEYVA